ncbi:Rne/Rng family ribonuclease [Lapillicoccus sp.]|uniref:Rne/Rng family ribonuclease n=1 Tax=Lapillicoccus sp. TaxID=1909287 RepID=UPI003983AF95
MASTQDTTPTQVDEPVTDQVEAPEPASVADEATAPPKAAKKTARKRATRTTAPPAPDAASTDAAGPDVATTDAAGPDAAPAKKAARKRASRKAAAPVVAPEPAETEPAEPPVHQAEPTAPLPPVTRLVADPEAGESATTAASETAPATPRRRRGRAAATRAAAAPSVGDGLPSVLDPGEAPADARGVELPAATEPAAERIAPEPAAEQPDPEQSGAEGSGVPALGVLFQAPARTTRSRRASAPVAAPRTVPDPSDLPDPTEDLGGAADLAVGDRTPASSSDTDHREDDSELRDDTDESEDSSDGPRRRRRRGGKGRRGRGSDSDGPDDTASGQPSGRTPGRTASQDQQDLSDETSTSGPDDADGGPDMDEAEGGSRRRTRRRRRSGSSGETEDAPGVVTRVREPRREREQKDEVTGLKGSTRLEAKKQRRREGREAGRRRTIITEAEFLSRRESVERVMVVRNKDDRTQIGVLEDGVLVEHYISQETTVSMAGNIYLGRVQNVLPSMEAAFVDIGKGRNAVLYAGEVNWDAAGLDAHAPKRIEHALSSGESVLVQVTKDPIGHKGARLTSQISLPGRYLVYVPDSSMTGISRKLPDTERARLKKILKEVVPESAGVIVRTAAEGASEAELRADVERLSATWEDIRSKAEASGSGKGKGKAKSGNAPLLLHGEPDLTVRVIRDVFNEDFASLVVAGQQAWDEVSDYVGTVAPDLAARITRWTSEEDLFTHYRVDEQIAKAMDRKVWLPSGGSLVIDRTEAMTVVDVNTGKFIGSGGNLEETVTKNNIEAAEEIVRQLRLRDIGGIIVIDFIDMVLEANRDLVVRRLLECLGRDRTKHQVAEVTSLGLVQMTRKRVGSGLIEVFGEVCEHCNGRGIIVRADPVARSGNGQSEQGGSASGGVGGSGSNPSGSAGAGGGASGAGSRSGSRGRREGTATSEPAAPPRSMGPTAAQIAAAAHGAALKSGEIPTAVVRGDLPAERIVPTGPTGLDDAAHVGAPFDDQQGELELVSEILVAQDGDLQVVAQDVAPEVAEVAGVGDVDTDVDTDSDADDSGLRVSAPEAAPAAAPIDEQPDEHEQPNERDQHAEPSPALTGRGRRRRGRVVAPAGPPRGGASGGPGE